MACPSVGRVFTADSHGRARSCVNQFTHETRFFSIPGKKLMAESRWTPRYETFPLYQSPLAEFSKDR
jgi:hypothetical protein